MGRSKQRHYVGLKSGETKFEDQDAKVTVYMSSVVTAVSAILITV